MMFFAALGILRYMGLPALAARFWFEESAYMWEFAKQSNLPHARPYFFGAF